MIQQRNISKLANRLYTEACDRVGKKLALRIQETNLIDECSYSPSL